MDRKEKRALQSTMLNNQHSYPRAAESFQAHKFRMRNEGIKDFRIGSGIRRSRLTEHKLLMQIKPTACGCRLVGVCARLSSWSKGTKGGNCGWKNLRMLMKASTRAPTFSYLCKYRFSTLCEPLETTCSKLIFPAICNSHKFRIFYGREGIKYSLEKIFVSHVDCESFVKRFVLVNFL